MKKIGLFILVLAFALSNSASRAEDGPAWQTWVHNKVNEIKEKQEMERLFHCSSVKTDLQLAVENVSKNWPMVSKTCDAANKAVALINVYAYDAPPACIWLDLEKDGNPSFEWRKLRKDLLLLKEYLECK